MQVFISQTINIKYLTVSPSNGFRALSLTSRRFSWVLHI